MSLIARIKEHEGYRQFPYYCPSGKLTCGYGRNLEDRGISVEEAEFLLLNDIKECEADLHVIFDPTPATMSLSRWEALMDMRYNLGPGGFRGFGKMIQAIKDEDWDRAADECMDSAYARQVPNRARENATALKLG